MTKGQEHDKTSLCPLLGLGWAWENNWHSGIAWFIRMFGAVPAGNNRRSVRLLNDAESCI